MVQRFTLINKLSDIYEQSCKPICQKLKLPLSAFSILMFLSNHPECYTAKDISKSLSMKPSIVSFNVDKLVHMGYLSRLPVPEDRRQIKLMCTEKAQAIIEKGKRVQREMFDSLTRGLSQEDLRQFTQYLDKLADNASLFQANFHF